MFCLIAAEISASFDNTSSFQYSAIEPLGFPKPQNAVVPHKIDSLGAAFKLTPLKSWLTL